MSARSCSGEPAAVLARCHRTISPLAALSSASGKTLVTAKRVLALHGWQIAQRARDVDRVGAARMQHVGLRRNGFDDPFARDCPPLRIDPRRMQRPMQIVRGRLDIKQRRAGGRQFHEHGVHQVLGIRPPSRERQRMAKQRRRVPVIQLAQRFRLASREVPQQFPIALVVARAWHS